MTQVHEWGRGVGPAAAAIEADEAGETTTTTHRGTLNPGPFETEAEARDASDLPEEWAGPCGVFFVYQKYPPDGKWWRGFWTTTTLPPLEEGAASVQGPLRFRRLVLSREKGGDDTDSQP